MPVEHTLLTKSYGYLTLMPNFLDEKKIQEIVGLCHESTSFEKVNDDVKVLCHDFVFLKIDNIGDRPKNQKNLESQFWVM